MAKARVNYRAIIETIFFDHYREGITAFEFERSEIEQAAIRLNVDVPDNLGDVVYTFRYRRALPDKTLMVSAEPPRSMKLVFGCRFGAACGVESLAGWVWWRRRRVSVVLSVM